jgi:hypothetical protein
MNTQYCQLNRCLLLAALLVFGVTAQAAESGGVDLPYRPPLKMRELGKTLYGKVVETMDSPPYTYVLLDTGNQKVWAAGPLTPVKPGDAVGVSTEMPMQHFHSSNLKRDFELIYFSNQIAVDGKLTVNAGMDPHQGMQMAAGHDASLAKIKKAEQGKTIAEVYAQKDKLAGQRVRVRGKVIKYIGNVFGQNWLHIQDASSQQQLVVITKDKTDSQAVVLVEGTVTLNKDNGIGHVYEVALDKASLQTK